MTELPQEWIEALAKRRAIGHFSLTWDQLHESSKEHFRWLAREDLNALLPLMREAVEGLRIHDIRNDSEGGYNIALDAVIKALHLPEPTHEG